jgi:hypothetical protein
MMARGLDLFDTKRGLFFEIDRIKSRKVRLARQPHSIELAPIPPHKSRTSAVFNGTAVTLLLVTRYPGAWPVTRPYGPVSRAAKHPARARPSKCIIIIVSPTRRLKAAGSCEPTTQSKAAPSTPTPLNCDDDDPYLTEDQKRLESVSKPKAGRFNGT